LNTWAEGQFDRLPALAAELVRQRAAVIAVTGGPAPAFAAKDATAMIPIVFTVGDDPVRLGLVGSLARPDGNVTGISFFANELAAKRLELLRELVPSATRIAVLVNPSEGTNAESTLKDVETAASAMGLQIKDLNASTSREINAISQILRASGTTPSSSALTPSSPHGVSNWPFLRGCTRCQ
jgi:putative tryptophan/tyrosine transport system substrate-binding protein